MTNVLTIARRELGAAFTLPVGYVFLAAFLALSSFLGLMGFFERGVSDLRDYFEALKWSLLFFGPAIAMRLWAEERRSGRFELLSTFPVRPWELVLGKYLGALALVAAALAFGATLPLTLSVWASFDTGQILGGYLGAIALASIELAVALVISALTENQIVAFVLGGLACFALITIGDPAVVAQLDRAGVPGPLLRALAAVSVADHHEGLARGVLDTRDVCYFIAGTAAFLLLNVLAVERRPHGLRLAATFAAALAVVAFALASDLGARRRSRVDLTSRRVFSLSPATREVLAAVEDRLTVRAYLSHDLPPSQEPRRRQVLDLLEDLEVAGKGRVKIEVLDPGDDPALQKRAEADGVSKITVQQQAGDASSTRRIYAGISVLFQGKPPSAVPLALYEPNLELQVARILKRLVAKTPARVAIAQPGLEGADLVKKELEFSFTVEPVNIPGRQEVPSGYKVLLLDAATSPPSERTLYACDQFLMKGGSIVVLLETSQVDLFHWKAHPGLSAPLRSFLEAHGIDVRPGLVHEPGDLSWNLRCDSGQVVTPYRWFLTPLPASSPASPIFANVLGRALLPFAAEVAVLPGKLAPGARAVELVRTGPCARRAEGEVDVHPLHLEPAGDETPRVVALAVEGRLLSAWRGKSAPPRDRTESGAPTGADPLGTVIEAADSEARIVVFGDADFLKDDYVRSSPEDANLYLALNAIEWAAGDRPSLASIRARGEAPALAAAAPGSKREAIAWGLNVILFPALIALVGVVRAIFRHRAGELEATLARAHKERSTSRSAP